MRILRLLTGAAIAASVMVPGRPAPGQPASPAPRVVEVTAKKFAFAPAEIRLRKGEPVTLRLTTLDVRHGLFSRPLGIDAEFDPGAPRDVTLTPQEPGTYVVICDRFCGSGHGSMKISVVVE